MSIIVNDPKLDTTKDMANLSESHRDLSAAGDDLRDFSRESLHILTTVTSRVLQHQLSNTLALHNITCMHCTILNNH